MTTDVRNALILSLFLKGLPYYNIAKMCEISVPFVSNVLHKMRKAGTLLPTKFDRTLQSYNEGNRARVVELSKEYKTTAEIADILRIPVSTVSSYRARARTLGLLPLPSEEHEPDPETLPTTDDMPALKQKVLGLWNHEYWNYFTIAAYLGISTDTARKIVLHENDYMFKEDTAEVMDVLALAS